MVLLRWIVHNKGKMFSSSFVKDCRNQLEFGFRRGPQPFIESCKERIQQSPLQYFALFALKQSRAEFDACSNNQLKCDRNRFPFDYNL